MEDQLDAVLKSRNLQYYSANITIKIPFKLDVFAAGSFKRMETKLFYNKQVNYYLKSNQEM